MFHSQAREHPFHNEHHDDVLQWIAEHRAELPTPLYLYSESGLNQAVTSYRTLFPENTRGFYSLKSNPQPELVRRFSSLGIGAEIAGQGEWQLCALADVLPSNVLAGGVTKSKAFLQTLGRAGTAAIVIESETEWQRLKEVTVDSPPVQILLRINPGVSFGGLNMAGGSQFGLSIEQAILIARDCTLNTLIGFLGLHFYFGSQRLEVSPIIQAVDAAEATIQTFQQGGIELRVVDLGLGCGVPYQAKDIALDTAALGEQLHNRWQRPTWSNLSVWFEAGRALVAASGNFVARVAERKRLHGETFIFLDGGLNVHNPGVGLGRFFRRNPQFCFITDNPAGAVETVNIVGNLCTTSDTLGTEVTAPKLEEGDLVVIPNSGAYCQTTAMWGFNSQPLFFEGIVSQDGSLNMCQPQYNFSLK
jgi:diaminopimelate decarboxylase